MPVKFFVGAVSGCSTAYSQYIQLRKQRLPPEHRRVWGFAVLTFGGLCLLLVPTYRLRLTMSGNLPYTLEHVCNPLCSQ
jgi:hypothetical protein